MRSLYQYIFELSSTKYKQAAKKAAEFGQHKRAEEFANAAKKAQNREESKLAYKLEKEIANADIKLYLNADDDNDINVQNFYSFYVLQGVDVSGDLIDVQFSGNDNVNQAAWENAVAKAIEDLCDSYGASDWDPNNEDLVERYGTEDDLIEAAEQRAWDKKSVDNDYYCFVTYDKSDDSLWISPDTNTYGGPSNKKYKTGIDTYKSYYRIGGKGSNVQRLTDRRNVKELLKLVKILNPETQLTKNDFIA